MGGRGKNFRLKGGIKYFVYLEKNYKKIKARPRPGGPDRRRGTPPPPSGRRREGGKGRIP